jgi:hypothetical protein
VVGRVYVNSVPLLLEAECSIDYQPLSSSYKQNALLFCPGFRYSLALPMPRSGCRMHMRSGRRDIRAETCRIRCRVSFISKRRWI